MYQWDRIESTDIDLRQISKGSTMEQRYPQQKVLQQVDIHVPKTESRYRPYILCKN